MSGLTDTTDPFDTFLARVPLSAFLLFLFVRLESPWFIANLLILLAARGEWLSRAIHGDVDPRFPIRLLRADTLEPAEKWRALLRDSPLALFVVLKLAIPGPWPEVALAAWLAFSALVALRDTRTRAPHDYLAGTVKMYVLRDSKLKIPQDRPGPSTYNYRLRESEAIADRHQVTLRRAGAASIDAVLLVGVALAFTVILVPRDGPVLGYAAALLILLTAAYGVGCHLFGESSLGAQMAGLRLESSDDKDAPASTRTHIYRLVPILATGTLAAIPLFAISADDLRMFTSDSLAVLLPVSLSAAVLITATVGIVEPVRRTVPRRTRLDIATNTIMVRFSYPFLELESTAPPPDLHPFPYGPVMTGPPNWARLEAPAGDDRPAHGRRSW